MAEDELFAITDSGKYHRRECSYAKNAKVFMPLKDIPAGSVCCDRCAPPPLPAPEPEHAPTEKPKQEKPTVNPEAQVECVCVKKSYHGGVLYNPGDRAKISGLIPHGFRKA